MDARQLLERIEARGGVASVKTDGSGAAKINVAPRSLALELLPDLQRFKPALLELLAQGASEGAKAVCTFTCEAEGEAESEARARVRPEVARQMPGAQVFELGRLLLRLDSGEGIE